MYVYNVLLEIQVSYLSLYYKSQTWKNVFRS